MAAPHNPYRLRVGGRCRKGHPIQRPEDIRVHGKERRQRCYRCLQSHWRDYYARSVKVAATSTEQRESPE